MTYEDTAYTYRDYLGVWAGGNRPGGFHVDLRPGLRRAEANPRRVRGRQSEQRYDYLRQEGDRWPFWWLSSPELRRLWYCAGAERSLQLPSGYAGLPRGCLQIHHQSGENECSRHYAGLNRPPGS